MSSSGPEIRNTRPLSYFSVVANIALWAAGPRNDITDCTLCSRAYTEPGEHTGTVLLDISGARKYHTRQVMEGTYIYMCGINVNIKCTCICKAVSVTGI